MPIKYVASAVNTAATKYVDVGRAVNAYTLSDLPAGKYNSLRYMQDREELAGKRNLRLGCQIRFKWVIKT